VSIEVYVLSFAFFLFCLCWK